MISVKLTHFYKEVDIYYNCENEKLIFLSFMYIKYHPLFPFPSLDPFWSHEYAFNKIYYLMSQV